MELFNKQDSRTYTAEKINELKADINKISDNDILTINKDDFVEYYYDKYYIQPINLLKDDTQTSLEKTKIKEYNPFYGTMPYDYEPKSFFVDGYKINYGIPFEGDSDLLFLKPTMHILNRFEVDNILNRNSKENLPSISFSIDIKANQLEQNDNPQKLIDDTYRNEFKGYECMIGYVNNDINNYNKSLKKAISDLLEKRKNQSSKFTTLMSKINIPLKTSELSSNTTPLTLSVKKESKKYPEHKNNNQEEYSIKDEDYINIKNIIKQACISFERTAQTFNKLDEEELRDFLLANLNTHYNSLATGETFSKKGKTDIRIQFENKAAYIAECKIWHGISEFNKAIAQLFNYITWRDVKTSLIIFNKNNKDFKSIIEKVKEELKNNELCISYKEIEYNNWQCTLKKYEDSEELIQLNILISDLYVED